MFNTTKINDATAIVGGATIIIDIVNGNNLVAKDRTLLGRKKESDPYVIIRYQNKIYGRTRTVLKNCKDPVWNETIRIELNADTAQELLQLYKRSNCQVPQIECCIMDEDLLSNPDPMGVVLVPIPFEKEMKTQNTYTVATGTNGSTYYCHNATGTLQIGIQTAFQQMYQIERGNVLNSKQLPLGERKITVGLSWDVEHGQMIDLDTSCVAIDHSGNIVMNETVYYGNLSNPNRSIVHSGDETTGMKQGDDETIDIDLNLIPNNVTALYILSFVASPPNATFALVQSAQVRILSTTTKKGICRFVPKDIGIDSTALFLIRIARCNNSNDWTITPIEEGDKHARDFGSLLPEIKGYTRDLVPHINIDPHERIAIMRKGGVIRVTDYISDHQVPEWLTFGLAWNVTNGVSIDLDASAILLDSKLQLVDQVWFRQLTSLDGSIKHSGDEREGDSIGDDERISFSLSNVPAHVAYIGLVINSYSGQELDDVSQASCHLFDSKTKIDVAKYTLTNCDSLNGYTALVMGCLYRSSLVSDDKDNGWYLRIIAEAANGRTVHDNVDELQRFLQNNPPQKPSIPPEPEIILNEMPEPKYIDEEEIVIPIPEEEIHVLIK